MARSILGQCCARSTARVSAPCLGLGVPSQVRASVVVLCRAPCFAWGPRRAMPRSGWTAGLSIGDVAITSSAREHHTTLVLQSHDPVCGRATLLSFCRNVNLNLRNLFIPFCACVCVCILRSRIRFLCLFFLLLLFAPLLDSFHPLCRRGVTTHASCFHLAPSLATPTSSPDASSTHRVTDSRLHRDPSRTAISIPYLCLILSTLTVHPDSPTLSTHTLSNSTSVQGST